MQAPFFLMTGLYLLLTALVTLDSSLASLGWMPAFAGLKWMRVHFITLGVLTQLVFGLLPALTAKGLALPKPKMSWSSWLVYNTGLMVLLIGLPIIDQAMIITGGTLIFIAVLVLMKNLIDLRRAAIVRQGRDACSSYSITRFYLGGLVYLLIGVLVGTGLWIGWAEPLRIAIPKEVHVHTNLWGYTALVFAGLIFDLFPSLAHQRLFNKARLDMLVFATMALGALGLVIGPWLDTSWPAVAGLVLHTLGTLVLVVQLMRLVIRERQLRHPGVVHLVSAYVWLLVPVVVAPFIVAKAVEHFPVDQVAGNGGPILIYGWILTFSLAILPYFFAQVFQPNRAPAVGGSWWSLAAMHLGSVLFWAALFLPPAQSGLRAGAFFLWFAALVPLLLDLYTLAQSGTQRMERTPRRILPVDTVQTD
jgi:cytochrome c oxidase cbb3-type subunit I